MDIKVNRGVLRFVKMNHITEKNLNVNKEAPQSFSSKYQREGCLCAFEKGNINGGSCFLRNSIFFSIFFSFIFV